MKIIVAKIISNTILIGMVAGIVLMGLATLAIYMSIAMKGNY